MAKNKIHPVAAARGYKTMEAFYKDYPTRDSFAAGGNFVSYGDPSNPYKGLNSNELGKIPTINNNANYSNYSNYTRASMTSPTTTGRVPRTGMNPPTSTMGGAPTTGTKPEGTFLGAKGTDFSTGNLVGAAVGAATNVTNTVMAADAANDKKAKDNAIIDGTVQTTRGIIDTVFPIVGLIDSAAAAAGSIVDATNPNTTYTTSGGENIQYKDDSHAAAWKASYDPWGSVSNGIKSFSGTKENYGRSDLGMGLMDIFGMQWISEGLRNEDAKKIAEEDKAKQMHIADNSAMYAQHMGAYKDQMDTMNSSPSFKKGGALPNIWTLIDDNPPLGRGGHLKHKRKHQNTAKDRFSDEHNNDVYISGVHSNPYNPNMYALGGQMTTEYSSGGTHEQNPNGGIPVGQSLVEQGEIRFDYLENKQPKSYIFSNRLKYKK